MKADELKLLWRSPGAREIWKRKALARMRLRSRQRGLVFDLTVEDVPTPERCPVLDIELYYLGLPAFTGGAGATIDSIDDARGYVRGNIWVISRAARAIKQRLPKEQLREFMRVAFTPGVDHSAEFFEIARKRKAAGREVDELRQAINAEFGQQRVEFPAWLSTSAEEREFDAEAFRRELNEDLG